MKVCTHFSIIVHQFSPCAERQETPQQIPCTPGDGLADEVSWGHWTQRDPCIQDGSKHHVEKPSMRDDYGPIQSPPAIYCGDSCRRTSASTLRSYNIPLCVSTRTTTPWLQQSSGCGEGAPRFMVEAKHAARVAVGAGAAARQFE